MSKEQTPITAEEWLNKEGIEECCDYLPPSEIAPLMEQYAKAKVLEALEPQREFIGELLTIFNGNGVPNIRYVTKLINQYYETAVKPKYE